ncbi:MAG: nucleotide sugar dehydrogenase, partial [Gammaproteobacteria bacterium]
PVADPAAARHEYGIDLVDWSALPRVNAIVLAVAHKQYKRVGIDEYLARLETPGVMIDVKWALDPAPLRAAGVTVWRL